MNSTSSLTRPHISQEGPGIWGTLHSVAKYSDDHSKPKLIIKLIKVVVFQLSCQECRQEAIGYLKSFPPDDIVYGFTLGHQHNKHQQYDRYNFRFQYPACHYLNLFHNWVNLRLGKTIYDLSASLKLIDQGCSSCNSGL